MKNLTRITIKIPAFIMFFAVLLIFSGCGRGNSNNPTDANNTNSGESGSYSLAVSWPESGGSSRFIPSNSSTIEVSITGEGLESAITTSINAPDSILTVSNIPIGNKVATVKAFDSSSNLTAQRKVSFEILLDKTVTSDSIPLGIAITGDTSSPIFEPSTIDIPYDSELYVQNWLTEDITPKIDIDGTPQNPVISGACQNPDSHMWVFSDTLFTARHQTELSIPGKSSAAGIVSAPIVNYVADKMIGKNNGDGTSGSGNAEFNWPSGIAIDSSGNMYITDYLNSRVQKLDSAGQYLSQVGSIYTPHGLAVDSVNNLLYVTNAQYQNYKIKRSNLSLSSMTDWVSLGTGDNQPNGICLSPSGAIYAAVGYTTTCRIQKYSSSGASLGTFGTTGTGDGEFTYPFGIVADENENIYVTDYMNHRIQKFTSTGTFLKKLGKNGGDCSAGSGNGEFSYPIGLVIDKHGYLYVSEASGHRIQKFDLNGKFITKFGSYGTEMGRFNQPYGLAFDPGENLYVTDFKNNRIQRFKPVP